jgi:hypothetical protein
MATFLLVKNDTFAQIRATITREDSGEAVNLTGDTTKLRFRALYSTAVLFTLTAIQAESGDYANGIATFTFGTTDLDLDAGEYEGEIEITYADSTKETVFELINFIVREDFG